MTDWQQLLDGARVSVRLRAPAARTAIREAEAQLGHALPPQLSALLEQTDGFHDVAGRYEPCWPLARLVEENHRVRRDAVMPRPDGKLCFGDNGAGEPFLLVASTAQEWGEDVRVWSWIDQEARSLAPSLAAFWEGWLDGSISS